MRERDLHNKEAVQAAVRQIADEYLDDANITSVGVGYKVSDGAPTDALALQFTVARKFAPEALEAQPTRPIPARITANGIDFTTDVLEREFEHHPTAVALEVKSDRKRRVDPMAPGVSIANIHVTAGTLGCLVRETGSGQPHILSNWHVLHGDEGAIGDPIVQPGRYDDNRTAGNRCGALVRSFLGLAGDCAIASVAGRGVRSEILGLGVAVRRLGDPALGDRVVKSGRTTDVTYGVVTRIHTITKLDYGRAGVQRIGGFEIGPDAAHPAANGEISMGGDSGSPWMAVGADGAAQDMMLGLHFAGETTEPAEYALACYAAAVFEKLEIAPLDTDVEGRADPEAEPATGYDPAFLAGHRVAAPAPAEPAVEADYAPTTTGATVRDYMHFSLAMSASRRFCRWVAWNVDGGGLKQLPRKGLEFVVDGAYEAKYQVGDGLYAHNELDRGHIARRADLLWGAPDEAQRANVDSFFFTNITPQLADFNQSRQHGLWGELEDAIFADAEVDHLRLSVFGGPIFKDSDFRYRGVLVPRSFWKIVAYVEQGALKAKAFVLTQDDLEAELESLGLEQFKLYQVPVADLTAMTQLDFGALAAADTMPPAGPEAVGGPAVRRIDTRDEIVAN